MILLMFALYNNKASFPIHKSETGAVYTYIRKFMVLGAQRIWPTPEFPPYLPSSHQWAVSPLWRFILAGMGNLVDSGHDTVISKSVRISWETYDYILPDYAPYF